jgi:hypothetical protein
MIIKILLFSDGAIRECLNYLESARNFSDEDLHEGNKVHLSLNGVSKINFLLIPKYWLHELLI